MKYEAEIWINASPERVYAVLSDVEKMYIFDPEVKSVTITSAIKRGVGVQSHWIAEKNGVIKEWNEVVTVYDPPRAFGFNVMSETCETMGFHELFPKKNGTNESHFVPPERRNLFIYNDEPYILRNHIGCF